MAKIKSKKFTVLICLLSLFLTVLVVGSAAVYFLFIFHDGYPIYRYTDYVDMREFSLTTEQYESLQQQLPDSEIQWMVPIGEEHYDNYIIEIEIDDLNVDDISSFSYLERLVRIKAPELRCYDNLIALQNSFPDCHVEWFVHMGSASYHPTEQNIDLDGTGVTPEEIWDNLPYLTQLKSLKITDLQLDGTFQDELTMAYPDVEFFWNVEASGVSWPNTATTLDYSGRQVDVQSLLDAAERLPHVESIDLRGCGCSVEDLLQIQEDYNAEIFSELSLYGLSFDTHTTELDFSNIPMEDTSAVEQILPLMPMLQRVVMCNCGISSDEMDALGKRNPDVRFIWTVRIGRTTLRTDETGFIGAKHGYLPSFHTADPFEDPYNRLFDKDCVEFKYCVDMVCFDLGHMGVLDYSFLQNMTKMKYLMLVDTHGQDFSFLQNMPELIYLELFLTDFSQTEYLVNLKNLKDLNIAYTKVSDITYLKQMTWLERLWISHSKISYQDYLILKEALPNTEIDYTAPTATEHGWRSGRLYFEMRDYLGMYYLPDKVYD